MACQTFPVSPTDLPVGPADYAPSAHVTIPNAISTDT